MSEPEENKISKEEEEAIDKFEKLNGIDSKDVTYLFAIKRKDQDSHMFGEVSDEFVLDIVMRLLIDHPAVVATLLGDFIDMTMGSQNKASH